MAGQNPIPISVEVRERAINEFVKVAGDQAFDAGISYLKRTGWNATAALQLYNSELNCQFGPSEAEPVRLESLALDRKGKGHSIDEPEKDSKGKGPCSLALDRKGKGHSIDEPKKDSKGKGPEKQEEDEQPQEEDIEKNKSLIEAFLNVTNQTPDLALDFLKRSRWNMSTALDLFYQSHEDIPRDSLTLVCNGKGHSINEPEKELPEEEIRLGSFTIDPVGLIVKKPFCLEGQVYQGLYKHQKDGLTWLWDLHCKGKGGILADDMGVGKTRQVSSFLAGLIPSGLIKKALLLVPPILIKQWVEELAAVGLKHSTHIFRDPKTRNTTLKTVDKEGGVLLCSTGLVNQQWDALNRGKLWDYLIFDEGHKLSSKKTQLFTSVLKISSRQRLLLTGTPLQNKMEEIHTLLDFCCPGLLGSLDEFEKEISAPAVSGNYADCSKGDLIDSSSAAQKLRRVIEPFILRRTKKEILTLPEKNEFVVWLTLTPVQKWLYKKLLETAAAYDKRENGRILVTTMIMEKICNHPCRMTPSDGVGARVRSKDSKCKRHTKILDHMIENLNNDAPSAMKKEDGFYHSCKIDFILKLLNKIVGEHKVLIFSQTPQMLDCVQDALSSRAYNFFRMDGRTNFAERQQIVDAFKKEDSAPILLLTTRVGGTGLDLPVASRVIIVEPAWNPSIDNQCSDRCYRLSQRKDVVIYRLITISTIEQYKYQTQIFKSGLSKMATENTDYQRQICKQMGSDLLKMPKSFSESELQKRLVRETLKSERSKAAEKELKILKVLGFQRVSMHEILFSKKIQLHHPTMEVYQGAHIFRPQDRGPKISKSPAVPLTGAELKAWKKTKITDLKFQINSVKAMIQQMRVVRNSAKCEQLQIKLGKLEKDLSELNSPGEKKDLT